MKVFCASCGTEIQEEDVLGVGTFDRDIGKYAGNTFVSFICPQCQRRKYQFVTENPFKSETGQEFSVHPELNADELVLSKRAARIDCNDIIDFHRNLTDIQSVDDFLQVCVREKDDYSSYVGMVISQPVDIYNLFVKYNGLNKDRLMVCLVDTQSRVVTWETRGEGMSKDISFSPQEIFQTALLLDEDVNIIIAHNSCQQRSSSSPSKKTILRTKRLVKAGRILGIEILDHILISPEGFQSFEQLDLL